MFVFEPVSLYSAGCPGTHYVDQAGLELRSLPAFVKDTCVTAAWQISILIYNLPMPIGTHYVDWAGLELRSLPAFVSQVLRSKTCVTAAWQISILIYNLPSAWEFLEGYG